MRIKYTETVQEVHESDIVITGQANGCGYYLVATNVNTGESATFMVIQCDGRVRRINDLPKSLGLPLNSRGQVLGVVEEG